MCLAVKVQGRKISFMDKSPMLPVRIGGKNHYIPWGRKINQASNLPLGKRLWLTELRSQVFSRYFPRAVNIMVDAFLERDKHEQLRWTRLVKGQCLQGVLLRDAQELRVYVVAFGCRNDRCDEFEIWPYVIMMP